MGLGSTKTKEQPQIVGNMPLSIQEYRFVDMLSSSSGWVILPPIAVMLSSIAAVMFSLPVIFWANAGVVIAATLNAAIIAIATNNACVFIVLESNV